MTILKENKLFTLLVVVLAIAGGIFLLLVKQFSIVGGVLFEAFYNATDDSVALAFGPIVASIFMFISAVLGAAKIVLGAKK